MKTFCRDGKGPYTLQDLEHVLRHTSKDLAFFAMFTG
jgi:hypothetical protein